MRVNERQCLGKAPNSHGTATQPRWGWLSARGLLALWSPDHPWREGKVAWLSSEVFLVNTLLGKDQLYARLLMSK